MSDLKAELRAKLAGSSSQQPIDLDVLAQGHHRKRVLDTLRELEAAHEAYCCLIIKGEIERMVWWSTRSVAPAGQKGIVITKARKPSLPRLPRMSKLTLSLLHKVTAQPGISRVDLITYGVEQQTHKDDRAVKSAIGNLLYKGFIASKGRRFGSTYTVVAR